MEPYFSTKPPGGSAGLGLPFVYRLITRSRGRVEIDSIVGEGTTVTLKLEAAESPAGGIDRAPCCFALG
jgi:signal transduction histidine kinase